MTRTDYFSDCASLDEARKTYYRLAMKLHPNKGGDEELFKELANQFHSYRPILLFLGRNNNRKKMEKLQTASHLLFCTVLILKYFIYIRSRTTVLKNSEKGVYLAK